MNRREWLIAAGAGVAASAVPAGAAPPAAWRPGFCLNTSTVRGHQVPFLEKVAAAAKAGYDGIEPWVRELEAHRQAGQSLRDLAKRFRDAGLKVAGAIGFARWVVNAAAERRKGVEQLKRDMATVRAAGGDKIAAPPSAATKGQSLSLDAVAERYAAILRVGADIGVTPILEVWGFSKNLSRLAEASYVLAACGRADACALPDVYHLYRGGSPFAGLGTLAGKAIGLFHINDYPDIPRQKVKDSDRVHPGDGVAPLADILRTLRGTGYRGMLSLELFNRDYWKKPVAEVIATGLKKMRAAVAQL